eukprot:4281414-Prymnesium_polylepis.2
MVLASRCPWFRWSIAALRAIAWCGLSTSATSRPFFTVALRDPVVRSGSSHESNRHVVYDPRREQAVCHSWHHHRRR